MTTAKRDQVARLKAELKELRESKSVTEAVGTKCLGLLDGLQAAFGPGGPGHGLLRTGDDLLTDGVPVLIRRLKETQVNRELEIERNAAKQTIQMLELGNKALQDQVQALTAERDEARLDLGRMAYDYRGIQERFHNQSLLRQEVVAERDRLDVLNGQLQTAVEHLEAENARLAGAGPGAARQSALEFDFHGVQVRLTTVGGFPGVSP